MLQIYQPLIQVNILYIYLDIQISVLQIYQPLIQVNTIYKPGYSDISVLQIYQPLIQVNIIYIPEMEFKEFEPRFKFGKIRQNPV